MPSNNRRAASPLRRTNSTNSTARSTNTALAARKRRARAAAMQLWANMMTRPVLSANELRTKKTVRRVQSPRTRNIASITSTIRNNDRRNNSTNTSRKLTYSKSKKKYAWA